MPTIMRQPLSSGKFIFFLAWLIFNTLAALWGWQNITQNRDAIEQATATTTQTLVGLVAKGLTESTRAIDIALQGISAELSGRARADDTSVRAILGRYHRMIPEAVAIRVTDRNGVVRWGTDYDPARRVSLHDRDFFLALRSNSGLGLYVGKVIEGRITNGWLVPYARAILAADGAFAGTVVASIPVAHFETLLAETAVGPDGIALLRDVDTALVARYPPASMPFAQVGAKGYSKELAEVIDSGVTSATIHPLSAADGRERISSYRRLSVPPFHVVVGLGTDDYLGHWKVDRDLVLAAALAFVLTTTLATVLLWRQTDATRRAEFRNRLLLRNASDGVHILDEDGHLLDGSASFFRMLGYAREELIGKRVEAWDAKMSHAQLKDALVRQFANDGRSVFESSHRRKDGTVFDVEITGQPIEIGGERLLFNSSRDISERKRLEGELLNYQRNLESLLRQRSAELESSEERFRAIVEQSIVGIGIAANGRLHYANRRLAGMFGFASQDEVTAGGLILDFVAPPHRDVVRNALAKKEPEFRADSHIEFTAVRRDGTTFPAMAFVSRLLSKKSGEFLAVVLDVSQQKTVENELREREQQLQLILDSVPALVSYVDTEERYIYNNREYADVFGPSFGALKGRHVREVLGEEAYAKVGAIFGNAIAGETGSFEGRLTYVDGVARDVQGRYVPHKGSDGRVKGVFVVVNDISEIRRTEARLRNVLGKLADLSQRQTVVQTVALLVHELNQPLNAVSTYSAAALQLLDNSPHERDRLAEILSKNLKEVQRAGYAVRHLMYAAQGSEAAPEVMDLVAAAFEAVQLIREEMSDNLPEMQVIAEQSPLTVLATRLHIDKVLLNLLRNAVESIATEKAATFTGRIEIRLSARGGKRLVSVADNGKGMEAHEVPHVFEPFYTTKRGGLGMGLAICRALVDSNGGEMWCEKNRRMTGATFYFTLPTPP